MMWNNGNDRWDSMHDQSGVGWLMVLLMLVIAIAVVVAVVALLRGTVGDRAPRPATGVPAPDARAILQDRFARGDIDETDFRSRMRALDETSPRGG